MNSNDIKPLLKNYLLSNLKSKKNLSIGVEIENILYDYNLKRINPDLSSIISTEALQKNQAQITVKSSPWVVNLSASVRPIMTYLLFIEFMLLTFMLAFNWIDLDMYNRIWSNEIQAVWAAVVSFWFGQRSFNRK